MRALALDLLRSRRVLVASVCSGLLLVSIGYLALYPSFEGQLESLAQDLPDAYRAVLGDVDLASPEGYIRSQVYSLMAPLLIAGAAIAAAASMARAERDRTLAVLVVMPMSRRRLAGAWWMHVAIIVGICGVITLVGVVIGAPLAGANVGPDRILLATLPLIVFGLLMGGVALLVSALTGAPGAATGAGWLTILVAFVVNSMAELVDSLGWLGAISPWAWHGAGEALTDSFGTTSFLLLTGLALLVGAAAVVAFERRNLHL